MGITDTCRDEISSARASRPELNRLMADAAARKFEVLLVWKLDRFGHSLVSCLNNIQELARHRVRFIAVTPGPRYRPGNPASRFLLRVFGAAAEFELSLIRERTLAGQQRYRHDYTAGKVGETVYSRSGKNLPPYRPKRIFNRDEVATLRARGSPFAQLPPSQGLESAPSLGPCRCGEEFVSSNCRSRGSTGL
jgi:DNA invertase Pin-like site-specific DNA recombinase